MKKKSLFIFAVFLTHLTSHLFSQSSIEEEQISYLISISEEIVANFPKVIKKQESAKIYLENSKLYNFTDQFGYLLKDKDHELYIPFLFQDDQGLYLVNSYEVLVKKPFKNVCNTCGFEWEKGGIVIWCPSCGSTNIRSNVPNT